MEPLLKKSDQRWRNYSKLSVLEVSGSAVVSLPMDFPDFPDWSPLELLTMMLQERILFGFTGLREEFFS